MAMHWVSEGESCDGCDGIQNLVSYWKIRVIGVQVMLGKITVIDLEWSKSKGNDLEFDRNVWVTVNGILLYLSS